jgi:hypothetical protein
MGSGPYLRFTAYAQTLGAAPSDKVHKMIETSSNKHLSADYHLRTMPPAVTFAFLLSYADWLVARGEPERILEPVGFAAFLRDSHGGDEGFSGLSQCFVTGAGNALSCVWSGIRNANYDMYTAGKKDLFDLMGARNVRNFLPAALEDVALIELR